MLGIKLSAIAVAASLVVSGANAVPLDFVAEALGNERGIDDGDIINFGGVNVTFSANPLAATTSHNTGYFAYFDDAYSGKPGGLGVCKALTSRKQCTPASDDNLQFGETLTLSFLDSAVNLFGLTFRSGQHNNITTSGSTLLIGINGGALGATSFAAASAATFFNISSITFGWGGGTNLSKPSDYYISGAQVSVVPVPASLPLLLGGIGLLGFGARRRKKKAA